MGKKIEFSKEQIEEIIKLYITKNKSAEEISKIYNCCSATIYNKLKEHNIKKDTYTKIQYKELYELYIVQNLTQKQIAKKFKRNVSTICILLKKYNIKKSAQQIIKSIEKTCLINFGVKHPAQNKEVQEKMKQTTIKRFGVENASQSEEIKKKKIATCLINFGVENPFQSKDVRKKIKRTNIERYGYENVSQNEDVKNKRKVTNLERFGVEYTLQSKDVRKKIKRTNIERFGVENPSQSEEIKKKKITTSLINFGVEYHSQRHIPYDKLEILYNKDKLINWLNSIDYKERTSKYCSRQLNISTSAFSDYIKKYNIFNLINHAKSEWENEAKRWFELNYPDLYVLYNNRTVIKPYELDIYIPELNTGIELNGSYWHSDKVIREKHNMCAEEYHNMKNKLCKEHDIKLYTIWDTDLTENNTLGYCLKKIFNTLQ